MDRKMLLELVDNKDIESIKELYIEGQISTEEYKHFSEMIGDVQVQSYDLTPAEHKMQYKRTMRYYNALTVFCLIDIIPFVWMLLFFIYIPVVIYTWIVAFGKDIIVPDERAVQENNTLGKFIIMSWIPGIGIIADIAILAKTGKLKRMIKDDCRRYEVEYKQYQQQLTEENLGE